MKFKQTLIGMIGASALILGSANTADAPSPQKYAVKNVELIQYSKPDIGIDPVILGVSFCGVYSAFKKSRRREIEYGRRTSK